jgi:hypothetical protein
MSQDNVWMAVAGLSADGRRLLDRSRLFSENHYYQTADHTTIHDIALHIAGWDTLQHGLIDRDVGLGVKQMAHCFV